MHKELIKQNLSRIEKFYTRLQDEIIIDSFEMDAKYSHSKEPVKFEDRLKGEYVEAKEELHWGGAWDSAWFNLKATVPQDWAGSTVAARINLNGEALIFDESGCPVFGLSGGSVFSETFKKEIYVIAEECKGGEDVDLWVEAAANNIFGLDVYPGHHSPKYKDGYRGIVEHIKLVKYDLEKWHLGLDISVLMSLLEGLGEKNSPRKTRIIKVVCQMIDMYLGQGASTNECREFLKQLWTPANASDMTVTGIGHAHIDTGWLWPVRETVRKCARTFASQIDLIERYPDYVFGASQPQHYLFVKENYPELYEKIKKYIKEGRWELQGGMWVEADCNIISGESMVRQFVHGKNFFMDEFGEDINNLWLPDVFGYSAAMPQILKKSGVDFFMTQKISWNQFNEFPFSLFNWSGIDGTSIVTHFLPENDYNSEVKVNKLIEGQERFNENHVCDEYVSLFGIGDGGGGPKDEHIERGLRIQNLEGSPKWKPGKAGEAFDRMRGLSDELATWSGELYLELHRGTLTSQALVKKWNRMLENKLRAVEFMYSSLPFFKYPSEQLDKIWKTVLINQFHDIIPGSSIQLVYDQTHKEYKECLDKCDELLAAAAKELFVEKEDSLTVTNVLSVDYTAPIDVPASWSGSKVCLNGEELAVQHDDSTSVVLVAIPANSTITLTKGATAEKATATDDKLVLENDLITYEFDNNGRLIKAFDKQMNRDAVSEPANVLSLYEDTPLYWDAWDVDVFYENLEVAQAKAVSAKVVARGDVKDVLEFELEIGESTIKQLISLATNTKRLDFDTTVDWKEKHHMLRVAFPTTIMTNECTCDIQYGHVKRANHRNTSWDMAKFEIAAHKYVDLSDNGYGVALLNDCKYGFKVVDNLIDMNLLRSPTYPDPDADIRVHEFTYSILPHDGILVDSNVIDQANMLNNAPVVTEGYASSEFVSPCKLTGKGGSLEAVKKAEKEDCHIIRIVETDGRNSKVILDVADKSASLIATNLMEWEEGEAVSCAQPIEIVLKPFEIATYKIK